MTWLTDTWVTVSTGRHITVIGAILRTIFSPRYVYPVVAAGLLALGVWAYSHWITYVEIDTIPKVSPERMRRQYPNVIFDGHKLRYDPQLGYYVVAGTKLRVEWVVVGGDDNTPPVRILKLVEARLVSGEDIQRAVKTDKALEQEKRSKNHN